VVADPLFLGYLAQFDDQAWLRVVDQERATIGALGYVSSNESRPAIRLACMAQAFGPVTLAIPPWNGQIGARLEKDRVAGLE
jgi:hypothetical protein